MGLNVVLNIEQSAYMKSTRVRALVDEFGLDVEPNKATNFAIEKVKK